MIDHCGVLSARFVSSLWEVKDMVIQHTFRPGLGCCDYAEGFEEMHLGSLSPSQSPSQENADPYTKTIKTLNPKTLNSDLVM